ncbi:MAG: head-tail joining protein [Armatimonadota bacterium]
MDFKDQIAADIDAVFLNLEEFGDPHTVVMGGASATVTAVLDTDEANQPGVSSGDGVYYKSKRFHVKESALPKAPIRGKVISIDGDDYLIQDISREIGMLMLTLEVYDSGGG